MMSRTPYGKALAVLERAGMPEGDLLTGAKRSLLMTATLEGEAAAISQAKRIADAFREYRAVEDSLKGPV